MIKGKLINDKWFMKYIIGDGGVWVIFILVIWKRNTKVEEGMNNEMEITYIIMYLYID